MKDESVRVQVIVELTPQQFRRMRAFLRGARGRRLPPAVSNDVREFLDRMTNDALGGYLTVVDAQEITPG